MRTIMFVLLVITATVIATTTNPPPSTTTASPSSGTTTTTTTTSSPGVPYSIFGCRLTGNQVLPTSSNSTATGIFIAFYDGVSKINYYLMHNVQGATGVSFHENPNGLANTPATQSLANYGPNQLITGSWVLSGQQISEIFNNQMYIQVESSAFPNGEIRSTIGLAPYAQWSYVAFLNFNNVVGNSASNGAGLMIAGINGEYFGVNVQHNLTDANAITIYGNASYCTNGQAAFYMPSAALGSSNVFDTATNTTATMLANENMYIQINTPTYPNGAIRGQIQPVSYYTSTGTQTPYYKTCITQVTTLAPPSKSSVATIVPNMIVFAIAVILSLIL